MVIRPNYALIRKEDNTIRRIVNSKVKPTKTALPIEYKTFDQKLFLSNEIIQNEFDKWEVLSDKVVVTYEFISKDYNLEKQKVLDNIRSQRKNLEYKDISFNYDNQELTISINDKTLNRLLLKKITFETDPNLISVDWELQPYEWTTLDLDKTIFLINLINKHFEYCFSKSKELELLVNEIEENDFESLFNFEINF